jgi:hypothetical protein
MPSTNGSNGRDDRGRFAKGNAGGPGNPYAHRVATLRNTIVNSVSEEDLAGIIRGLVDSAKKGDVQAAKVVLAYTVGAPRSHDDIQGELDQERQETMRKEFDAIPRENIIDYLRRETVPTNLSGEEKIR